VKDKLKIKGKIKIYFSSEPWTHYNRLCIKVKFKLPNQIFYSKSETVLISEADYYENNTYNLYNEDIINLLNNKECLIKEGEKLILNYIKNNKKQTKELDINKKIKNNIKEINKNGIEFEMEVKE
jgi:hypothetical protein